MQLQFMLLSSRATFSCRLAASNHTWLVLLSLAPSKHPLHPPLQPVDGWPDQSSRLEPKIMCKGSCFEFMRWIHLLRRSLHMNHGDVVVTQEEVNFDQPRHEPPVVASAATVAAALKGEERRLFCRSMIHGRLPSRPPRALPLSRLAVPLKTWSNGLLLQ